MTNDVYRMAMYKALRPFLEPKRSVKALEISGWALKNEFGFDNVRGVYYPDFDICNDKHVESMGKYDLVFADQVLEHVKEPQHAVDNLKKLLNPGGCVVVTTVCLFPLHDLPGDYWRFTPFGLEHLFRAYKEVKSYGWGNRTAVKFVPDWGSNNVSENLAGLADINEPDVPIVVWAIATL